jgi:CYTH domain-containing protein
MAIEIERKYEVKLHLWEKVRPQECLHIHQAYLSSDNATTVRIRTSNQNAYITIKGKTIHLTRPEFEYPIPYDDALQLMQLSTLSIVEKNRFEYIYKGKKWEVDEFLGSNKGLVIAEIELNREDELFFIPEFIGEEQTSDPRFRNSNLAKTPYESW